MSGWSQALARDWPNWSVNKWRLGQLLGVSDDALHVCAGLGLLLVAGWLLRRPPWHWAPWLVVLLAEVANEAYDLTRPAGATTEANWAAAAHDLWLTLAWPTVILLLFPRLVRRYPAAPADPVADDV